MFLPDPRSELLQIRISINIPRNNPNKFINSIFHRKEDKPNLPTNTSTLHSMSIHIESPTDNKSPTPVTTTNIPTPSTSRKNTNQNMNTNKRLLSTPSLVQLDPPKTLEEIRRTIERIKENHRFIQSQLPDNIGSLSPDNFPSSYPNMNQLVDLSIPQFSPSILNLESPAKDYPDLETIQAETVTTLSQSLSKDIIIIDNT